MVSVLPLGRKRLDRAETCTHIKTFLSLMPESNVVNFLFLFKVYLSNGLVFTESGTVLNSYINLDRDKLDMP